MFTMESKWFNELEYLRKAILEDKKSYEQIGREYGCSGGNIKKVAKRMGIGLPPRRKLGPNETFRRKICTCLCCGTEFEKREGYSNKFCSSKCELEYKHAQKYRFFLEHPEDFERASYSPRAFKDDILREQGCCCAICGMLPMWNGKQLTFVLDHIDGHASHNRRENLRMICPNCDSQLDTYKSRNKNGERSYYRYHRSAPDENQDVEEG